MSLVDQPYSELPVTHNAPSASDLTPLEAAGATSRKGVPLEPHLAGTVVCLEALGKPVDATRLQGQLTLSTPDAEPIELGIHDGQFAMPPTSRITVDPHANWMVRKVTLDDLVVERLASGQWLRPGQQEIQILVTLVTGPLLHVIDARDGEELASIEIRATWGRSSAKAQVPGGLGDWTPVVHGVDSPLSLATLTTLLGRSQQTLVGAPGYAWAPLDQGWNRPEGLTVELWPGADIDLSFPSADPDLEARLWIRPLDGRGSEAVADFGIRTNSTLPVRGLLPGSYDLSVLHASQEGAYQQLAQRTVTVFAGQNPPLAVPCSKLEQPTHVPCSFLLELPDGWGTETPNALLWRPGGDFGREPVTQKLSPTLVGKQRWRLEAESCLPGLVEFQLIRPRISFRVQVPPDGLVDYPVTVPAPEARVSVTLIGTSEEPAAQRRPESLQWHVRPNAGSGVAIQGTAQQDKATGLFQFSAPVGELFLFRYDEDEALAQSRFDLHAGDNDLVLHLVPQLWFALRLLDGSGPLSRSESQSYLRTLQVAGPGRLASSSLDEDVQRFGVTAPGTYTLTFPATDTFAAMGPLEIQVDSTGTVRHELTLTRTSPL